MELVGPEDFSNSQHENPIKFILEVDLRTGNYLYELALEWPKGFREVRVLEEKLVFNGAPIFTRNHAQVRLARASDTAEAMFRIDWHLAALPIIQEFSEEDPIFLFKDWLSKTIILRPIPSLINGTSDAVSLRPEKNASNIGEWFTGLTLSFPRAYSEINNVLLELMPDLEDIQNLIVKNDFRRLIYQFKAGELESVKLPLESLSDGEKCFLIFALAIVSNKFAGPLLCFWDEPDNYLAIEEINPLIISLRRAFREKGQLIVTSHNSEAIRSFSDENTLVFSRKSHHEHTIIRRLDDLRESVDFKGDVTTAFLLGQLAP